MGSATARIASVLARLPPALDRVVVRDGERTIVGVAPEEVVLASGPDAIGRVDGLVPGWWAGVLSYDLGRGVERIVPRAVDDLGLPDLALARFDARLVIDRDAVRLEGEGPTRRLLAAAAHESGACPETDCRTVGPWSSTLDRAAFESRVRAIVGMIEAGDCYQVNLTRRLTSARPADPDGLFLSLLARHPAPHAALVRVGPVTVVSASPERFLRWRDRYVETRPIKGTGVSEALLRESAKDRAENVMIVDLARNDLGRVCDPGSIAVPALWTVEHHPGLEHLVSTVAGRLRPGIGTGELLRATFPPASVTGAPKPRVLQAIEDLEPVRRGPYCGAIGWLDTRTGAGDLSVAIRTFVVARGATHLGVGAGIVADSVPSSEWAETELKAARLLDVADADHAPPLTAGATR